MLEQEFAFTLPKGLIDPRGEVSCQGKMRFVNGKDEFFVRQNSRLKELPQYSIFVILSRVITKLGNLSQITPELLEQLFLVDFNYLQQLYYQINQLDELELDEGELWATP